MLQEQELTALVSSRICHDLISPIGAISNGVELLSIGNADVTPELGLIGESVASATLKLRCFRIAFGAAGRDSRLPVSEVHAAAAAMFTGRASVVFDGGMHADIPRLVAKGLFLALLCQERCLPLGGRSEVRLEQDGFEVSTAAPRLRDMGPLWDLVDGAACPQQVIPAEVQYPLLGQLLSRARNRLERDIGDNTIRLALRGLTP